MSAEGRVVKGKMMINTHYRMFLIVDWWLITVVASPFPRPVVNSLLMVLIAKDLCSAN